MSNDGNTVAIGAISNSSNGLTIAGKVKVYQNIASVWTQVGQDIDGEYIYEGLGYSIDMSNDASIIAISAPWNSINGDSSGYTKVYNFTNNVWTQIGQNILGDFAQDFSGNSISLSSDGTILAIGALQNDFNGTDSGHARVYKNVNNTWTQVGQELNGLFSGDRFGNVVSLSDDGNIIAVSAYLNDNNGIDSGYVTIYKNINDVWTQVGNFINGEGAGDQSGCSIDLSSDGSRVAIGATNNDGNGTDSGHVRVYDLSSILSSDSFIQANFKVYPNPVSEILTIELQNNLELQNANFYNTLGQLVKTTKTVLTTVSDLSKGSYYVEVITKQSKSTKAIIIE